MDNTKTVYVNVRMIIDEHADAQEVVDNCDYWFQHEDDIKRTEIVDYWPARVITDGA